MDYIKRDIEDHIEMFLNRREIIAVIGPRQVGKTTLLMRMQAKLERAGKRVIFLNFEQPTVAARFEDTDRFAEQYCVPYDVVIMDEFHFAADGGRRLKLLFDTHRTKFIISGSSSLELTFQTGKYLVGRYIPFVLLPFSFREYLRATARDLARLLDAVASPFDATCAPIGGSTDAELANRFASYAVVGGYPAATLAGDAMVRRSILRSIYDAYLLHDIRDLLQLATDRELQRLTHLLAGQVGNRVVFAELGTPCGLSQPAVKRHLHILDQTYIIELIRPFFRNARLEIVKNPKVYFLDAGIRNAVLDAWAPLVDRADAGALVEQCVFGGLRRFFPTPSPIRYWRSQAGAEVDFVVEREGQHIPIEVKWQSDPKPGKSFRSFLDRYAPPRAYLVTAGATWRERIGTTDVRAIPAWYWS